MDRSSGHTSILMPGYPYLVATGFAENSSKLQHLYGKLQSHLANRARLPFFGCSMQAQRYRDFVDDFKEEKKNLFEHFTKLPPLDSDEFNESDPCLFSLVEARKYHVAVMTADSSSQKLFHVNGSFLVNSQTCSFSSNARS